MHGLARDIRAFTVQANASGMGYPSKGLGKCNVDGFLRGTLKEAGCEGVCRNDSG